MTEDVTEPDAELTSIEMSILQVLAEVDIAYEMKQYTTWATKAPPSLFLDENEAALLSQGMLEVRVLHLRNLADFLRKPRPDRKNPEHKYRLTDVVADHYFDAGWTAKPRPMKLYSSKSRDRDDWVLRNINAHLTHITRTRVDRRAENEEFDWGQVEPNLVINIFETFITDLRRVHPERAQWFDSCAHQISTMRARLEAPDGPPPETTTNSAPRTVTSDFSMLVPPAGTTNTTLGTSSMEQRHGET